MECIYCGHVTKVNNSRLQKRQNQVWRRRQCLVCDSIFTTLEKLDYLSALAVISQNRYKPFSRDKLLLSLYDSLKHRKTALNDATALTDTVIAKTFPHIKNGSIERTLLTEIALQILKRFDKSAATYYAAYHPV